jgi:hypothetical protein
MPSKRPPQAAAGVAVPSEDLRARADRSGRLCASPPTRPPAHGLSHNLQSLSDSGATIRLCPRRPPPWALRPLHNGRTLCKPGAGSRCGPLVVSARGAERSGPSRRLHHPARHRSSPAPPTLGVVVGRQAAPPPAAFCRTPSRGETAAGSVQKAARSRQRLGAASTAHPRRRSGPPSSRLRAAQLVKRGRGGRSRLQDQSSRRAGSLGLRYLLALTASDGQEPRPYLGLSPVELRDTPQSFPP